VGYQQQQQQWGSSRQQQQEGEEKETTLQRGQSIDADVMPACWYAGL
jgi:hypothetical protein